MSDDRGVSDDRDAGRTTSVNPELWRPESTPPIPRTPPLLAERARLLTFVGCVLLVVATLVQPYAEGSEFEGTRSQISIDSVPDAGYLITLGVILAIVIVSRGAAESHLRIIQVAPFVLALTCLVIWWQIVRQLATTIDGWLSGSIQPQLWLAGIGATVALVGTGSILVQNWQATARIAPPRPAAPGAVPTERVEAGPSSEVIGVIVGGVAGFLLAVAVVTPVLPAGLPLGELLAILGLTLGGTWVGMLVGRRMVLG
jgi:hypothetical protein